MSPETKILILSLAIASVGFIIWYSISSSLRLPVRYQVMYDVNPVYVNRILRRRIYAVIVYSILPILLISYCGWFGHKTLSEMNIHLGLNALAIKVMILGSMVVMIMSWFSTKRDSNLEIYPEVRVRFWEMDVLIKSAISWVFYIASYEFFYRGLLLQSLLNHLPEILAIAICAALYCLTHYFKMNRLTFMSIVWGVLAPVIVLQTGSLWPVIIIHLVLCLSTEWFSILNHREMYIRRT